MHVVECATLLLLGQHLLVELASLFDKMLFQTTSISNYAMLSTSLGKHVAPALPTSSSRLDRELRSRKLGDFINGEIKPVHLQTITAQSHKLIQLARCLGETSRHNVKNSPSTAWILVKNAN